MMTGYYILQEITSPVRQPVLVKITAGDAVRVTLNGKERYIQSNPLKKDSMEHILLLDLEQGKNQLVVKLFNNFKQQTPLNIDFDVPQVIYRKTLPAVPLKKDDLLPVSWQRHRPATPHDDMGLPNLCMQLR